MDTGGGSKKRLGRGLAALIGDASTGEAAEDQSRSLRQMPIEFLTASPNNPRKSFAEADLEDLARSIRDKGLLQPIVVRPLPNGNYEIVAGERRWRAAQRAGVHDVPVVVRELSDAEALEIALIENVQRSDLNPLEEARAYSLLMERFSYTQQQLAESIGKSRSHIANTIRLLSLPETVRVQIEQGRLTAGHARALVATDRPVDLAEQIIKLGMSVREAEGLARSASTPKKSKPAAEKDANTRALEKFLSETLGLKVTISHRSNGSGTIDVAYGSLDQLEDVCRRLRSS
jgi:ParB family chromosome partitioning protein